jgi:hypothetical protein
MDDLSVPVLLAAIAFAWTMWAVLFWGGIAIIERHNPFNTFQSALLWSIIDLTISLPASGLVGLGLLLAWIVILLRLLLGRYELGMLHAISVVLTTVVGPYLVTDAFLSFVGTSETRFLFVLFGFPIGVFVVWRWPRPAPEPETNLPRARLARFWRRQPTPALAAKTPAARPPTPARETVREAPAPAQTMAPTIAEPTAATAPTVPAPAPIAPPALEPRSDDEPSFLH